MQEELNKGMADIDIQDDVSVYFYLITWSVGFFSPFVVLTTKLPCFYFAHLEMARFECDK